MKLQYTSIDGVPFCDHLTVTVPTASYPPLKESLLDLFEMAGLSTFDAGTTYQLDGSTGAFRVNSNTNFTLLSASGQILRHLRDLGLYGEYISMLAEYTHKITRLDATADYFVIYAPDVIQSFEKAANASKIHLTRKKLDARSGYDVGSLMRQNQLGDKTGTVYLGNIKTHSVHGKIYDKGEERRTKGFPDPGQVVRVELTLKNDTGISLRDAHNPEKVFYHYASNSIVTPPPHFTGWEPARTGYKIDRQQDIFTPAGKILNIFKHSIDVGKAIRIATSEFGDEALDVLISQFRIAFLKRKQSIT